MVSTIVTLYNKENYIRDCLNSILSNLDTYKDIEIIIVNDKSTDNSLNIVKELGTQILYDYKCKLKNTITQHLYTSLKLSVINKQNYEDIKKFYNVSDKEIDEWVDYVQQHISKVIYLD